MTQEFKISSELYSLENIQESIRAFSDISEIVYNNEMLSIDGESSDDIQEVFNEFMNYVLSL